MRNYTEEYKNRIEFIRSRLEAAHADGIVFGNSGGKDSALVGILCKAACPNTVGIIMPCASKRNYGIDADDGKELAEKFNIETHIVDLTPVREAELKALEGVTEVNQAALTNIAPPSHDDAVHHRRRREPPRGRYRQPQRDLHGLLYEVGRRRQRL